MGTAMGIGGGLVAIVVVVVVVVLVILWTFLPFAIFGIRKRVDAIADNEQAILDTLRGVAHDLKWANYLTMVAHGLREEKGADGTVRVVRP